MAHGNRKHKEQEHEYKDWSSSTNKKNNIIQWILNCMQHEKDISDKNKKSCELFHNRHRGI